MNIELNTLQKNNGRFVNSQKCNNFFQELLKVTYD
jgi:hypothetical protein